MVNNDVLPNDNPANDVKPGCVKEMLPPNGSVTEDVDDDEIPHEEIRDASDHAGKNKRKESVRNRPDAKMPMSFKH